MSGINEEEFVEYRLRIMKAIAWYMDITKTKQKQIAEELNYSPALINKSIISTSNRDKITCHNYQEKRIRLITLSRAEEICNVMDTTVEDVLFYYRYRKSLSDYTKINTFINKTNELKIDLEKDDKPVKNKNKHVKIDKRRNLITDINHSDFAVLQGKYFCYFSSTSSEEIVKKRNIESPEIQDDNELNELSDCMSDDYIFCGILDIYADTKDDICHADFKFVPNLKKKRIKKYSGNITISQKTKAVFCELESQQEGEKTYIIFDNQDLGEEQSTIQCCVAMVLTYSSKLHRRRPCCERMIMSKKKIKPGTMEYESLKVCLRMNDNIVRITEWGYSELLKEVSKSEDKDLKEIVKCFPNLESLRGNTVTIENCAFIPEGFIYSLNILSEIQKLKFEILLRSHSIAPWYCKTKAAKADALFNLLCNSEDDSTHGNQ